MYEHLDSAIFDYTNRHLEEEQSSEKLYVNSVSLEKEKSKSP